MFILEEEHGYLGAHFDNDTGAVSYYENEPDNVEGLTTLTDLSGLPYLLISSSSAVSFSNALCAGKSLSVGELSLQAVLSGDGKLVSLPYCLRTGNHEVVLLDISKRGEVLLGWLSFLLQEVGDSCNDLSIEDASHMLVPLLLQGPRAKELIEDYIAEGISLPRSGSCSSLNLDAIPCVVGHLSYCPSACYLILVPPVKATVLWRSFLSFGYVEPLGTVALQEYVSSSNPWGNYEAGQIIGPLSKTQLVNWGLAREADDFIGARGLKP